MLIARDRDRPSPPRREIIALLDQVERRLRVIASRWESVPAETRADLRDLAGRVGRMLERCGVRR